MNNIDFSNLYIPLAFSLLISLVPFTRKLFVTPYVTLIHEYGHTVANVATLGIPMGIKVYTNEGGGVAHSLRGTGLISGLGTVFSGISGYPAPILLGVTMIASVSGEYTTTLFFWLTIIAVLCIILMRNLYGFGLAILTAGISLLAYMSWSWADIIAYWMGSFLLMSGILDMIRIIFLYFRGESEESDMWLLKERFLLPQFIWLGMILAITWFGAKLILLTA